VGLPRPQCLPLHCKCSRLQQARQNPLLLTLLRYSLPLLILLCSGRREAGPGEEKYEPTAPGSSSPASAHVVAAVGVELPHARWGGARRQHKASPAELDSVRWSFNRRRCLLIR
jgi:hypothetical protein